jgi:probable rRNA maturation factor
MEAETCPVGSQVSLLICGDRKLRRLNRQWRGIDRPTDVLSFSQQEGGKQADDGFPGLPGLLGDVVISAPTAERQARRAGRSLQAELEFLLAHGILHLSGWQDDTPLRRSKMLARQQAILEDS